MRTAASRYLRHRGQHDDAICGFCVEAAQPHFEIIEARGGKHGCEVVAVLSGGISSADETEPERRVKNNAATKSVILNGSIGRHGFQAREFISIQGEAELLVAHTQPLAGGFADNFCRSTK